MFPYFHWSTSVISPLHMLQSGEGVDQFGLDQYLSRAHPALHWHCCSLFYLVACCTVQQGTVKTNTVQISIETSIRFPQKRQRFLHAGSTALACEDKLAFPPMSILSMFRRPVVTILSKSAVKKDFERLTGLGLLSLFQWGVMIENYGKTCHVNVWWQLFSLSQLLYMPQCTVARASHL